MLMDVILLVFTLFIGMVQGAFSLISIPFPTQAEAMMSYFVQQLSYVQGFINVPDILQAVGWFMVFTTGVLIFRLIIWGLGFIPGFRHISPRI